MHVISRHPIFMILLDSVSIFTVTEALNTTYSQFVVCDSLGEHLVWGVWAMVFNTTFNNISAISLQAVLLVEETRDLGENH